MQSDIFRAGVAPGGPATEDEIKMLLCYSLSNFGEPLSFTQLYDAMSEHNLINYFELVRILDKLVSTGHVAVDSPPDLPERYCATELGHQAAREFENTLPRSVRDKALDATRRAFERQKRLTEVSITQTPCNGGYRLELAIPEVEGELISFTLFAPTAEQCTLLKRRFLNAPLTIYKGVLALLTGDGKVLGEIFTGEDELF